LVACDFGKISADHESCLRALVGGAGSISAAKEWKKIPGFARLH
jgi:hypothetical protein